MGGQGVCERVCRVCLAWTTDEMQDARDNKQKTPPQPQNKGENTTEEIFRKRRDCEIQTHVEQAFMVSDENYGRQAQALRGLESFAGMQIGVNECVHNTLGRLQGQFVTMKSQKDLNLDWRMQALEEDLSKLQLATRTGEVQTLNRDIQTLKQHPMRHEMEKAMFDINLRRPHNNNRKN